MGSRWFEYKVPVEEDEKLLKILVMVAEQWGYTEYLRSVYIKMTKMEKILLHVFRHIFFKGRGCSKVMLTFASFFPISYIANFSLEHSRGLQKSKQLAGASRSHEWVCASLCVSAPLGLAGAKSGQEAFLVWTGLRTCAGRGIQVVFLGASIRIWHNARYIWERANCGGTRG